MTLVIKSTRKVVVLGWDKSAVQGKDVSIQVHGQEKRTTENDGEANIYFPTSFKGSVDVAVHGSKSGQEQATLEIV